MEVRVAGSVPGRWNSTGKGPNMAHLRGWKEASEGSMIQEELSEAGRAGPDWGLES